jgi:hypothetical protein
MRSVRVCVEIPEERYRAYESEAERRGTTVERLVEQVVHGLLEELDQDEREGTDHLIIPS